MQVIMRIYLRLVQLPALKIPITSQILARWSSSKSMCDTWKIPGMGTLKMKIFGKPSNETKTRSSGIDWRERRNKLTQY